MADNPMTDVQALGILAQLEAEANAEAQMKRARQHIAGVLQRFREVSGVLPGIEKDIQARRDELTSLDGQIKSQRQKAETELRDTLTKVRDGLAGRIQSLTAEVEGMERRHAALTAQIEATQADGTQRKRAIAEAVEAGEKRLATIEAKLKALKDTL